MVSGHDTTADANPGGLYKAPLILTEWSVHRFFGSVENRNEFYL